MRRPLLPRPLLLALIALVPTGVAGQTPDQIAAEPIVKRAPGETAVPGQCLTRQELDLAAALDALRRPTVGEEGPEGGDDAAPFDPHYFVGTWRVEGVLPESPLSPAGELAGTETVRHVDQCTYESVLEATGPEGPVTVTTLLVYDRRARSLVQVDDDSRGFRIVRVGPVGGDPGGYWSHHWEAPGIDRDGTTVRLRGRTYITSPFAYRLQMRMALDDGPYVNHGTVWWDRLDEP